MITSYLLINLLRKELEYTIIMVQTIWVVNNDKLLILLENMYAFICVLIINSYIWLKI